MEEVIRHLRKIGEQAETIYYLYAIDEKESLVGIISLREVLLSQANEIVEEKMTSQVVSVRIEENQERVVSLIQEYDLLAIPVVDNIYKIKGIITVDDIMDIMEQEVTEDFNEFAAIRQDFKGKITPFTIMRSRSPWIIILLLLGMITGGIIGSYEETLESVVLLAAFIPMIMATAGNVGMQSLVVSIRELNKQEEKINWRETYQVIKYELVIGLYIGIFSGVLLFLVILLFYRNSILALIVSLSVLITVGISTVIGALVPIVMKNLRVDPAVASGPFITTLADIVGILIYFSIATTLLEFL